MIETRSYDSLCSKDSLQTKTNEQLDIGMLAEELTTGSSSRQARLDKRTAGRQNYNKCGVSVPILGGLSCEPYYLTAKERPPSPHYLFEDQEDEYGEQSNVSEIREAVDANSLHFGEESLELDSARLKERLDTQHRATPNFHPSVF